MLFFYIRHGAPTYVPDALTPLGKRQAEAVARRLQTHGIDRIFSSTSTRVMQTAEPLCEILQKPLTTLAFAHESLAYADFKVETAPEKSTWVFNNPEYRKLMQSAEVRALGDRWYEHPKLTCFAPGYHRIAAEGTAFFRSLGYERIEGSGAFRAVAPTEERVALFAHQGFGLAFFSWLLNIPYPQFCTQFDFCHTGMSVVTFDEEDGLCYPKLLSHAETGHLYQAHLPLNYNNKYSF